MVVPFTLDRPRRWFEGTDQFDMTSKSLMRQVAASSYTYEGFGGVGLSRSVRWHNALLRDLAQDDAWLVLEQRGFISRFEVIGPWVGKDEERHLEPKAVMMLATVEDTDGDGELTSRDANLLIAGDADGRGLHPITPAGTQVWRTRYNADHNLILMMVVSDTNGEGLFTVADSAVPYVFAPGSEDSAEPLINPRLIDRAERLLKD